MLYRYLAIIVACTFTTACSLVSPSTQHHCEEPRPEICTREYVPVCAIKRDNSQGLYGNGCSACSNPEVTGYNEGACPQP